MNFFDHKDLENDLLQLCPKVVKHPVYIPYSESRNDSLALKKGTEGTFETAVRIISDT